MGAARGQHGECDVLVRLLKAVLARESRVLVMRGDPELDKTALLGTHLEQGADRGQRDLRGHGGDRGEVELVEEPAGRHAQPDSRITSVNVWQRRDARVSRSHKEDAPRHRPASAVGVRS